MFCPQFLVYEEFVPHVCIHRYIIRYFLSKGVCQLCLFFIDFICSRGCAPQASSLMHSPPILLLFCSRLCHYCVGGAWWHLGFYESF
jgi:hypothetical protein